MIPPITYRKDFLGEAMAARAFESLWKLPWLDVAGPRLEYYVHDFGVPYTYGRGSGERTYQPQEKHPMIALLQDAAQQHAECSLEAIFLNGYRDGNDHLGWHSDDSPGMDPARPIVIITLGAEREIYFRPRPDVKGLIHGTVNAGLYKHVLHNGSMCEMAEGMQQTWQHRIPKAGRVCGPRISLTFRGATL